MTKTPCKHLEALLPRESVKSAEKLTLLRDIQSLNAEVITTQLFDELSDKALNTLVDDYGLSLPIANLMIDRFVSGLTIKELAQQTGMSSLTIRSVLAYAVKKLKDRGVTFRG